MQRSPTARPVRRAGSTDTRRRNPAASGTAHRKEGSLRRDGVAGTASPRRRPRRETATIIVDSDTDASIEEIESPVPRPKGRPGKTGTAQQQGVISGLLWPLRTLVSIAISVFHSLVSPFILGLLPYALGILLAISAVVVGVKYGLPYLLQIALSVVQAPFKIGWDLLRGDLRFSDIDISRTLSGIGHKLPSGTVVIQGLCHVAPIPGLCAVGTYERMRAVQERDRAIVARKLQKEGMSMSLQPSLSSFADANFCRTGRFGYIRLSDQARDWRC